MIGIAVVGVVVFPIVVFAVYDAALVKITAEDGWIVRPVTLAKAGLIAKKTAVKADAAYELEGGGTGIVSLACALIGIVRSFRYPDLVAGTGIKQGVLQVFVGVCPATAIAVLAAINIMDAVGVCNCWH